MGTDPAGGARHSGPLKLTAPRDPRRRQSSSERPRRSESAMRGEGSDVSPAGAGACELPLTRRHAWSRRLLLTGCADCRLHGCGEHFPLCRKPVLIAFAFRATDRVPDLLSPLSDALLKLVIQLLKLVIHLSLSSMG